MGPADYLYAADTANVQAGGSSFLSQIGDAVTMGAPSAVVSGLQSIYNTGVDVANFFGADQARADTQRTLSDFDQNWGQYYADHKDVIDVAGFVATSFIPGGLAVKGLNLLRRGEAAGAFGRALNYTATRQTANLEAALQTLASPEGSVFTRMNKDFLGAISWGVADNMLQTATFELAVAGTMKASPLLDKENVSDMGYDILKTSVLGGFAGGAIEGLFMNRIVKDASKAVSANGKKYQNLLSAFDKTGLDEADKSYALMDSVLAMPKEVFTDDKTLNFAYSLAGQKRTVALDTSALRDKQLATTIKNAYLKVETGIKQGIATDADTGNGFAGMIIKLVKEGRDAGKADDEIRGRLGDYLFNLERIEPATFGSVKPEDLYFFRKDAKLSEFPLTQDKAFQDATSYRVLGDPGALKVATVGLDKDIVTTKQAWEQGYDLAMRPNGTWQINPASQRIRAAKESSALRSFLRLDTGATSDTAVLSAADIATADSPLRFLSKDTVRTGERQFKFSTTTVPQDADSVEYSARHLWASKLEKIDGTVSADDFSLLDRMSSAKGIVADETLVEVPGVAPIPWRDLGNFDEFVFNNKVSKLQNLLADGQPRDITELSYMLNTTPEWIQNVIASKFQTNLKKLASGAPDLTQGWQRDLASYENRDTVLLNYKQQQAVMMDDFGNTFNVRREVPMTTNEGNTIMVDQEAHRAFVTGQQAYSSRVKLAVQQLDTAFASVFGTDAARWSAWNAADLSGKADVLGSGAGLTSFADADYGDLLRLAAQDSGKNTHILSQQYANANLQRLQPYLAEIKNTPEAVAELVAVVTKMRRSAENFTMLGTEYGLDGVYLVDRKLLGKGASAETIAAIRDAAQTGTQGGMAAFRVNSDLVAQFLKEHMAINAETIQKRKVLYSAQGVTSNLAEDTLYVPPIDTRKVPYFAFVRPTEGKIFGDSNVSMITARSSNELQQLAGQIDNKQFDVIFKKDSELFHKAKGDYEYARGINESSINSQLKREGKLGDFMPSFQAEDVLEDFVQYHQRQATQLVRDGVSTKYSQTFTELRRLSEQYTAAATSKAEPIGKLFQRTVADPYDDYIKTALDISKQSEFTLLHQTNEFIDAVGTRAYAAADSAFRDASKGKVSWEQANDYLTRYGLGAPYQNQHAYEVAQTAGDRNLIKTALQKANMALATVTLRFDFANSLMNIISTPIMLGTEMSSIRNSIRNDPALSGKLAELTSVALPDGSAATIPTTKKLVMNAVSNFWSKDKDALLTRYKANGDVKDTLSLYHEMVNDLSLMPSLVPSAFSKKASEWTEKIASGFGNNFAEQFTRFVSADVMRQLTDPLVKAGKMAMQEQNAYISVFVNRVQGNYIASQRPILFQGTLGSALGLFQTYQFNLLQQLFRHIEDRDLKSVAVMAGLQTSLFGLNGLPLFEAINTNVIGRGAMNEGHKDIYSTIAGSELGDWLMYGTASAMPLFGKQGPSLYTRGDINPRHISVIPVTPAQVPAVDGSIRFVSNLINIAEKLSAGGDVKASLLEGLEHNSVSRPLAGLAQVLQGYSSTSKGNLISANSDWYGIANASRLLGAKPLDESIGLNQLYRSEAYKAYDRERLIELGGAVKTKLRNGEAPTDEEFQAFQQRYAAAGGRADRWGSAIQQWSKAANTSVLNTLSGQVRSSYGQRFVEVMGGERIQDFTNSPPETP